MKNLEAKPVVYIAVLSAVCYIVKAETWNPSFTS